jgi:hypothetical protein
MLSRLRRELRITSEWTPNRRGAIVSTTDQPLKEKHKWISKWRELPEYRITWGRHGAPGIRYMKHIARKTATTITRGSSRRGTSRYHFSGIFYWEMTSMILVVYTYLTMLPVNTVQTASNDRLMANNELDAIWKEAVVVLFSDWGNHNKSQSG